MTIIIAEGKIPTNVEIRRREFKQKQDIYLGSVCPVIYLAIIKREIEKLP